MTNFFPNPKLRGILFSHLRSSFGFHPEFDELIDGVPSDYAAALLDGELFNPVQLSRQFYIPWLVGFAVDAYKEFETLPKPVQDKLVAMFDISVADEFLGPDSVLRLFHESIYAGLALDQSDYCIELPGILQVGKFSGAASWNVYDEVDYLLRAAMVDAEAAGNFAEDLPLFYGHILSGWGLLIRALSAVSFASYSEAGSEVTSIPLSTRFTAVMDLYGGMVESHRSLVGGS